MQVTSKMKRYIYSHAMEKNPQKNDNSIVLTNVKQKSQPDCIPTDWADVVGQES